MIILDLLALWIAVPLAFVCLMIIKPLPADEPHNDYLRTEGRSRRHAGHSPTN